MAWADFLHPEFVAEPYWWEAYRPASGELVDLPREARVAIVGGGYAGLATALELARHGVEAGVLEGGALGGGARPRDGGVGGGGGASWEEGFPAPAPNHTPRGAGASAAHPPPPA